MTRKILALCMGCLIALVENKEKTWRGDKISPEANEAYAVLGVVSDLNPSDFFNPSCQKLMPSHIGYHNTVNVTEYKVDRQFSSEIASIDHLKSTTPRALAPLLFFHTPCRSISPIAPQPCT